MLKRRFAQLTRVELTVLGLSALGLAHFALGLLIWLSAVGVKVWHGDAASVDWTYFAEHISPVLGFILAYARAGLGVWRSQQFAWLVLFGATLCAAALCIYDVSSSRYQVRTMTAGMGCTHLYFTWWWY